MAKIKRGAGGLDTKLEAWADNIQLEVSKGVINTARKIETQAKTLAPVDTSALKDSIQSNHLTKYHSLVTVSAFYAPFIEFGTGVYAEKGSRASKIPWTYYSDTHGWVTTSGMRPQPFWTPSLLIGKAYFENYFGG